MRQGSLHQCVSLDTVLLRNPAVGGSLSHTCSYDTPVVEDYPLSVLISCQAIDGLIAWVGVTIRADRYAYSSLAC